LAGVLAEGSGAAALCDGAAGTESPPTALQNKQTQIAPMQLFLRAPRVLPRTLALAVGLITGLALRPAAAQSGVAQADSEAQRAGARRTLLEGSLGQAPATAPDAPSLIASVLGIEVRTGQVHNVGRIVDLLADPGGGVVAAVVEFGGFLGVGTRKIAIAWRDLQLATEGGRFVAILDIPRDRLRGAPEYKRGEPTVVAGWTAPESAEPSHQAAQPTPHRKAGRSLRKRHPQHAAAPSSPRPARRPPSRVGGADSAGDRHDR
jgi:hypothetical protein